MGKYGESWGISAAAVLQDQLLYRKQEEFIPDDVGLHQGLYLTRRAQPCSFQKTLISTAISTLFPSLTMTPEPKIDVKHTVDRVESLEKDQSFLVQGKSAGHYVPQTGDEKALDRRVNLKLDLCVTLVLAWGFILCESKLQL